MFIFSDEAGDFKFMHGVNISRYFILCTVRMESCEIGHAMLDLRRSMKRRKIEVGDMFHAVTDTNVIRTEVFNLLTTFKLDVDATILDKPKADPQTRPDEATFYRYAWFYHAKFVAKKVFPKHKGIYIAAAALETRKGKAAFKAAFNETVSQTASHEDYVMYFPFAVSAPCVQVADYCSWAIQPMGAKEGQLLQTHTTACQI